jgi:hypothetical protein
VKILKAIAWSLVAIVSILFVVGIIIGPSAHRGEPARQAARQPASHSAPIVDGPAYLASKSRQSQQNQNQGQPQNAGQDSSPAPAPSTAPAPSCMAAMQVIGHNAEAVNAMPKHSGSEDGMEDLHYMLDVVKTADSLAVAARNVATNMHDGSYCQRVVDTIPRLYPAWRDKQDYMSTDRLVTIMTVMRLMASQKAQLEAEASRDISH